MAPLLRQSKTQTTAGLGTLSDGFIDTVDIVATQNVAASTFLFLAINMNGGTTVVDDVTDTRGNTWTKWDGIENTEGDSGAAVEIWTAISNGAGANTITVDTTAACQIAVFFNEYTGIVTSSPRGVTGFMFETGYIQSHSVTTALAAVNGDLIIAGFNNAHTNETFSIGGGYSNFRQAGSATGLQYMSAAIQDRVATGSGPQSASMGTNGYDKGVGFIVAVKPLVSDPPAPPTNLAAVPANTSAAFSWSPSVGATSYTLRGGTSPNPATVIQSGITGTTYTKTGLTNGTPYYYTVTASNVAGESAASPFPTVTPAVPPPAEFLDWYAHGTKPSINAASMRATFRAKFDAWFGFVLTSENNPGTPIPTNARLPGPVKRIKAPDQGFYPDGNTRNGTVSEGQAYGAYFCALLSNPELEADVYWPDAKATFDALYRYYDYHKNERGFMNWHIYAWGVPGDFNGATDGDEDMAEALRVMSELHGDAGAINYGAEADALMKAMEDHEFVPETGYAYPNLMTNGDNWGFNTNSYMPDYSRMGYWHEWSIWLRKRGRTARADRWLRIKEANYDHIEYYVDSATYTAGVPDRQTRTYGTIDGDFNNQITYNSVRLGFGWMTDYLWHGDDADPRAKEFMDKIANRLKTVFTTGGNVKAPNYSPNLSSYQGYSNLTGFGYAGSVSLGLLANQTFATEIFNALAANTDYASSYFNGGIGVYALAVMSGAAQPFTTEASEPPEDPPPDPAKRNAVFSYWDGEQWVQLTPVTTVA